MNIFRTVFYKFVLADNVGIKTLFERLRKDNIEDITRNEGNLEYSMSK